MGTYRWHEHEFIDEVAQRRGATLTHDRGSREWRLDARGGDVPWTCLLTSAYNETDATVEWRTSAVRASNPPIELGLGYRAGQEDRGGGVLTGGDSAGVTVAVAAVTGVVSWLRRRAGSGTAEVPAPAPARPPEQASKLGPGWWVHDPSGLVDDALAALLRSAPVAWRGPGREAPAFAERCSLNHDHLAVGSSGWWASAAALDHHIDVGLAVVDALRAR